MNAIQCLSGAKAAPKLRTQPVALGKTCLRGKPKPGVSHRGSAGHPERARHQRARDVDACGRRGQTRPCSTAQSRATHSGAGCASTDPQSVHVPTYVRNATRSKRTAPMRIGPSSQRGEREQLQLYACSCVGARAYGLLSRLAYVPVTVRALVERQTALTLTEQ